MELETWTMVNILHPLHTSIDRTEKSEILWSFRSFNNIQILFPRTRLLSLLKNHILHFLLLILDFLFFFASFNDLLNFIASPIDMK